MSGFFAIHGIAPREVVDAIAAAGAHRGAPETWSDEGIVLAAFPSRRGSGLFVADDLVIAADLRIDNVSELALGASDLETLAAVWRRWGVDGMPRVIGDFAFAVWDRRTSELTVVRDPIGAKPSLYSRSRGRTVAASELAMVLADVELDRSIDEEWVAAFLAGVARFRRTTGYRSIARHVPGTAIRPDGRGGWREHTWHRWDFRPVRERDDAAYAEAFREVFDEAVRCRVDGAARVGVSLSGGMDSTSVAVTLAAVAPQGGRVALAVGLEDERGDERRLQQMVAERSETRLRWVSLDGFGPFGDDWERTLDTLGVPPVAPNWFLTEAVAGAASEEGVDVLLDGVDGDSMLQGSPEVFSDLLVTGKWRTWRREAKGLHRTLGVAAAQLLRQNSIRPLIPGPAVRAIDRVRHRSSVPGFMDARFARVHAVASMLDQQAWAPGRAYRASERLAVSHEGLPLVAELIDVLYARRGIEVAHPFLDRRVVEFAMGLPWEQKLRNGYTKWVLRRAMQDRLPTDITNRPGKADLSAPFDDRIRLKNRTEVEKGLALAASNRLGWCDPVGVRRLSDDLAGGRREFEAYRVACAALWAEREARKEPRGLA